MDEHKQMIEDCIARESRLSDWEREFIDSVGSQMDRGRSLTARQAEVLERIWDKATARG